MPSLGGFNLLSSVFMLLSTAVLLLFAFNPRIRPGITAGDGLLTALMGSAVVVHTAVNASLGTVIDRYGAKIMWFIPLLAMVLIVKLLLSSTFQLKTSTP